MTPDDHFRHLAEFVKGVDLAGGTTPHVSMTVEMMSRIEDPLEKLWFAGCYVLAYNWPTAERIWQEWRPYDGAIGSPRFEQWATEHKAGIPIRKERKAIYGRPAFAECAASYLDFAEWLADLEFWPETYADAYETFTKHVRYAGRYIAIRWLEVMRRAFPERCSGWEMTDLRADGGEHPRKAMALIYPEQADVLLGGNSAAEVAVVDLLGAALKLDLLLSFGVSTNYYELQSLLCEYKQAFLGRKHYPGKSIDTEMGYYRKVHDYWQHQSEFWSVRRACFPEWSLGELQGWDGVRAELGAVLTDYSYMWSDDLYDWHASKDDLSAPVLRNPNRQELL